MGSHYCHLKLDERRKLAKWLEAKMPILEIADRLGRDPSTIYRDIKRNRYTDDELPELNGYYALNAQDMYEKRRAIHRKMIVHPELKNAIEDQLKAGWSLTCHGIFPPPLIRVRPNLRTDNEANKIHGRTDHRHPG